MICSQAAYASPDGIRWSKLPFVPAAEDDTKPTAYYDYQLGKYVVSVRRDVAVPGKDRSVVRQVGRCVTDNISFWQSETFNNTGCEIVFGLDDEVTRLQNHPETDVFLIR